MNIAVRSRDWQFHINEQRELMCTWSGKKCATPARRHWVVCGTVCESIRVKSCRKRDLGHQKVTSKYLARTQDGELKQLHENHSKKAT
jgi:hypothetical protein